MLVDEEELAEALELRDRVRRRGERVPRLPQSAKLQGDGKISPGLTENLPRDTHNWSDGADDDLVETHLLVLAHELSKQSVEVVLEAPKHLLWLDRLVALTLERTAQLDRLALELADALDALHDAAELREFVLLRLDHAAHPLLLRREVRAALLDTGTFARERTQRRGEGRAEQREVVSQLRQTGRIGGPGAKGGQRRKRLVR